MADSNREELRLQGLDLGQERQRAQAVEGHAEALAADVERLCARLQDQQAEHDREVHTLHAQVQHIHECVAFAQSEKDLADRRLQELQQQRRGWSELMNSSATAPVEGILLTDVKTELRVAQKNIRDQAAQLLSAEEHIRMQAAELREAQLNMQSPSFSTKPLFTKPSTETQDDRKDTREPLSLRQLQGLGTRETLVSQHSTSVTSAQSLKQFRAGSWEEVQGEDQQTCTLSTTHELMQFIQSLDAKFDTGTHTTKPTERARGL